MCEDAALFLTTKPESNNLRNDFVCVMDMDFFELALRLCTNRSSTAPRIDLTASSNVLHIRTCSDSFKALRELLTYYSCEGDLLDPNQTSMSKEDDAGSALATPYSPLKEASSEPALITTDEIPERDRRMSESQTEHVHDLVVEAMEDEDDPDSLSTSASRQSLNELSYRPSKKAALSRPVYEIHFTPNADFNCNSERYKEESRGSTPLPLPGDPIMESANGLPIEIAFSDEDEEQFYILEDDPGVGIVVSYHSISFH
jgi:hypothetical protein